MKQNLHVELRGGLLLGGGSAPGLHDATLRDVDGVPYLPASALKGAIREQMQRLAPAAQRQLGLQPEQIEALFGAESWPERDDDADHTTGRIRLSDAHLADRDVAQRFRGGHGYGVRTQVSIDRKKRTSAHQRLFVRETVAPFAGDLVFVAEVDADLDKDCHAKEWRLFRGAVEAVFALGGGRTSGLGRVDMRLEAPSSAKEKTEPLGTGDVLVLEAVDPLCIGARQAVGNFHPTMETIPASTLRGALVTTALREQRVTGDQTGDPDFRRLWLEPDTCIRLGDAIPLAGDGTIPQVTPFSLRACKYEGDEHPVFDTLLRDAVALQLSEAGVHVALDDNCLECGEATRTPERWRGAGVPERRVMTRLALDPVTARGRDGQLFSLEVLERGTRFAVRVANVDGERWQWMEDAARGVLRVGHGRGQGYGRVRIVEAKDAEEKPLEKRLRRFDDAAREMFRHVPDAELGAGYLTATLLTDMVVGNGEHRAEDAFLRALGLPAKALHGAVRAGQRGGFQTREGRPKPFVPVVRAGSALLLKLDHEIDGALIHRLEEMENHGVGERREEGFGWVRFSDPVHLPQERRTK